MGEKLEVILKVIKQRPTATVSLVIALVLGVFYYIRGGHLEAVIEEQAFAENEWNRIEFNVRRARDLEQHLDQMRIVEEEIASRLMNPAEVAINYDYFYRIERETGVRLVTINQTGQVDSRGVPGLPALSNYSAVGYTLSVEGNFSQVLDFLSEVANGRFLARVSAINISSAAQGRGVTANLQCQILGVKE